MLCAAVGTTYIYFFEAPDKEEGARIAAIVLALEPLSSGEISGFDHGKIWRAEGLRIADLPPGFSINTQQIIETPEQSAIDALYMTRWQKERHTAETTEK